MKRLIRNDVSDIFNSEDFMHLMNIYGMEKLPYGFYQKFKDNASISVECCSNLFSTTITYEDRVYCANYSDVYEVIDCIDRCMNLWDIEVFAKTAICNPSDRKNVINAAISSRDLTKNMVRVKSSNVWSYGISIRDRKDKVGDVLAQFKGKDGGPGDIYIYYDVPITLWRRWIGAPSKGHFFWSYIRNNFKYSKLTGDRRGVLPNAINRR